MVQKQNMKALKLCIILLTITFVSCTKKTQTTNSRNDSVEKYLKLASIDTLPMEIRKTYNKKAFSFIDLEKNDTTVRWYLCQTAFNYNILKDSLNYYKVSNLHLKKANEANDTMNLARFYRYRGGFNRTFYQKYDSSLYYYRKAEKAYLKTKDLNGLAITTLYKGYVFHAINDYSSAELELLRAKKMLIESNNQKYLIHAYNTLGNTYKSSFHYKKALIEYNNGLQLIKLNKKKYKIEEAVILNNIGNLYLQSNKFKLAIQFYQKSLRVLNLRNADVNLFIANQSSILNCKLNLNQLIGLERPIKEILKLARKYKSNEEYFILYDLTQYYYKKGDFLEAKKYAQNCLDYAKESKVPYNTMNAWKQIGIVDKERASEAIIQFDIQVDSLLNKERRERSKFLKIQLETDEITQEREKAIKQKWVQTSIIATVLLIVILLFIIFKQRSQKKEFVLIQNQQKASEEIYQLMLNQQAKEEEAKQKEKKRIALELHDNVMNKLASTRFNLFTLTQKQDDPTLENAVQHIDKIKDIEDEIRSITHELSKETFSKSNSFTSLLTQLIGQQNQLYSTDFSLELDPKIHWDAISSEIKMNYYRIIQEAIHNTNKYAKATKSTVSLLLEENKLRLSISDNGQGFETNTTKQGIGIQNMQQRITAINGEITINSALGKGTVINCSVEI